MSGFMTSIKRESNNLNCLLVVLILGDNLKTKIRKQTKKLLTEKYHKSQATFHDFNGYASCHLYFNATNIINSCRTESIYMCKLYWESKVCLLTGAM